MIKKILILGASGMLGSTLFRYYSKNSTFNVFGTIRSSHSVIFFPKTLHPNLIPNVDVLDQDLLIDLFDNVRPDVVINCIGLIKQLKQSNDPLTTLPINAMLPHRLAKLCSLFGARLIHISTDCVFSGRSGMYKETDISDAEDLYGKSKYIGEVNDLQHAITLRTSIIGHELNKSLSLVDWFLSQNNSVKGFTNAIFSGLPSVELAYVIQEFVIPNKHLAGLYHVSVDPIDKYSLLKLISTFYNKKIDIIPEQDFKINRSLDSTKFKKATGYTPASWPELVIKMKTFREMDLDYV